MPIITLKKHMKAYLNFCSDASLQPPGVRFRKLTRLTVQFNPSDAVSCEFRNTIGLGAG